MLKDKVRSRISLHSSPSLCRKLVPIADDVLIQKHGDLMQDRRSLEVLAMGTAAADGNGLFRNSYPFASFDTI
jgi:hypothetical protein